VKRPRPHPPTNAPEGTVWFGGPIRWFSIALTVRADDLAPDDVTRLFLVKPTRTQVRGLPVAPRAGARVATFGSWTIELTPQETDEWDVSEAVRLLISLFPGEANVWQRLPPAAEVRLRIGLDLETRNQGFSLHADVLRFAADRNIDIGFDIYTGPDC
jgi:hypothetical protein